MTIEFAPGRPAKTNSDRTIQVICHKKTPKPPQVIHVNLHTKPPEPPRTIHVDLK